MGKGRGEMATKALSHGTLVYPSIWPDHGCLINPGTSQLNFTSGKYDPRWLARRRRGRGGGCGCVVDARAKASGCEKLG